MSRFSRTRGERGNALIETVLVSMILLGMVLGIVEFGTALSREHTLTSLSREGANLAARGSSLGESVDVVMTNGSTIGLASKGGAIATRIIVTAGAPLIVGQSASVGYGGLSHVGNVGDTATGMDDWGLVDGQSVHTMEVFYTNDQITPFGSLMGVFVPTQLYERAVF
jgi:hypothetical protein